ncbi:MAG: FeoA domain-containing protein, partial [Gemmatimonadetes bacterium]|nr:FeoA domain-containing protein [Gemmatimonadota bacterium]
HLVALGVLPGVEVTLLQRYPAFVMRIGHAEFAVDDELARRVHVGR